MAGLYGRPFDFSELLPAGFIAVRITFYGSVSDQPSTGQHRPIDNGPSDRITRLKMKRCKSKWLSGAVFWLVGAAFILGGSANADYSQSTDQSFPTAVTGNELTGTIKSRDIGDARVTSYYFTFNAGQGDLFINIVTKNLNGSVNLFAADGLRPLGQVLVYADLRRE